MDNRSFENVNWNFSGVEDCATHRKWFNDRLRCLGLQCAQDLIDIGCVLLFVKLMHNTPYDFNKNPNECTGRALRDMTQIREALEGTGICLRCDVPAHRFCLSHNTIGAADAQNAQWLMLESISEIGETICTRTLLPEEKKHTATMCAAQKQTAEINLTPFGVEVIDHINELNQFWEKNESVCTGDVCSIARPHSTIKDDDTRKASAVPQHLPVVIPACDHIAKINSACPSCLARAVLKMPLTQHALTVRGFGSNVTDDDAPWATHVFTGEEIDLDAFIIEHGRDWDRAIATIRIGYWRRGKLTRIT